MRSMTAVIRRSNEKEECESHSSFCLCQFCGELCGDGVQESLAGDGGGGEAGFHKGDQIFCHDAFVQGIEAGLLQSFSESGEVGQTIQLAALLQCAGVVYDHDRGRRNQSITGWTLWQQH